MDEIEIGGEPPLWTRGDVYDATVGRLSSAIAGEFLPWLWVPADATWLDVGSGTGVLTREILFFCNPSKVDALEPSENFLEFAKKRITDRRVHFHKGDTESMEFAANTFDAVVSGLTFHFLPDPLKGMQDIIGVTKPGGLVGAYVWDFTAPQFAMRIFWDEAIRHHIPDAKESDPAILYPLCTPENLNALFLKSGLENVEMRHIVKPVRFANFEEFWDLFVTGDGKSSHLLSGIAEYKHIRLKDAVRTRMQAWQDKPIELLFIASGAKGTKAKAEE
jgi:ubiquinone/menaquinone biosynthesis C-methylase UbiE